MREDIWAQHPSSNHVRYGFAIRRSRFSRGFPENSEERDLSRSSGLFYFISKEKKLIQWAKSRQSAGEQLFRQWNR